MQFPKTRLIIWILDGRQSPDWKKS